MLSDQKVEEERGASGESTVESKIMKRVYETREAHNQNNPFKIYVTACVKPRWMNKVMKNDV